METLVAALVLLVLLAAGFALLALPFVLVWMILRAPRHPAPPIRPQDWTDDDEILARYHH
ncbi:hypothetical protein [uncultured Amnibacterium sp.]|uniref:hypothetical protein n=1 Tax=uncultured Amnibacterium sp. TaxID=1631851 RepID=UPI0035C9CE0B